MRRVAPEVLKRGRKRMRDLARDAREEIRRQVPVGPPARGHAFRAVTSGTRGLNPTLKLNRDYRPYVGGLFFGAKNRERYPQFKPARPDGYFFYPTIRRLRPAVTAEWRRALDHSIKEAGLD